MILPQSRYCWLCGGKIMPTAAQDALPSTGPSWSTQPLEWTHALMFWLGAIVVALVGYGVLRSQDRLFSALYLLVVVPALLLTLFGATIARVAGKPWTPSKAARVGALATASSLTLVATIVATIIAIVATIVSFFVALFEICSSAVGGQ
jgi:hypothetical protein